MSRLAFRAWRPGMRCAGGRLRVDAVSEDGRPYRIEENRGFGHGFGGDVVESPYVEVYPHRGALPDLSDMPTVGALLDFLRERCAVQESADQQPGAGGAARAQFVAAMTRWIYGGSTEELGAELMQMIGPVGADLEGG